VKNLATLLFFLAVSTPVLAGIRPSFSPEGCSWRATDIVVVTEGSEIDGNFKVLETWKGDLKPGQTISIPELAQFKEQAARSLYSGPWAEKEGDGKPRYVSGARMILFLRDANRPQGYSEHDAWRTDESDTTNARWKPTNPMGTEMKYSTAWIEDDKVYAFVQIMNPGDSVLVSCGTESELKTEVDCVVSTQIGLNTALAIPDVAARVESLELFAKDSISYASDRAFAGLTECGEAALPVLRRILENESLGELHEYAVEAFAKAGGKAVGPELTMRLEKEVEFWKRTGPTLQNGWWNGKGSGSDQMNAIEAVDPLRTRYGVLLDLVYAVGAIRYAPAERVLIDLNNLSRSVPQLGFDQIGDACDEVLRESGANRKSLVMPKYEILFSGNKAFSSSLLTEKLAEYVAAYDTLEKEWIGDVIGGPVDYGLDRLIKFYTSHGYLNVEFRSDKKTTERGEVISVHIDEGKSYRLGTIRISGARLFSPERIRAMLKLRTGDIADGEAIDEWLNEDLRNLYHDQGYLNYYAEQDHQFRVESQRGSAEVVDINVRIDERPQYRIDTIEFQGKTSIPKSELSRAMLLREGDIFSEKQLDDSIVELNKLGFSLDKQKDVGVSEDHARETVTIKIILDKQGRANESFNRSTSKRSWYP
jgi:hypothetical protein